MPPSLRLRGNTGAARVRMSTQHDGNTAVSTRASPGVNSSAKQEHPTPPRHPEAARASDRRVSGPQLAETSTTLIMALCVPRAGRAPLCGGIAWVVTDWKRGAE